VVLHHRDRIFAAFSILTFVIDLPRARLRGVRPRSRVRPVGPDVPEWFSDSVISASSASSPARSFSGFLSAAQEPRRWWLYTGLAAVPFLLLMIVVKPVWIDPLFNTRSAR
jgi:hypothetical protein